MKSILCIDDDLVIQTMVIESLKNFDVKAVDNLKTSNEILDKEKFDAILLDIQLKDEDGLRILECVSKKDDFVTKPFDPLELEIRLNARLKKITDPKDFRSVSNILIDFQKQKVFLKKENLTTEIKLTVIQLKTLSYLTKNLDRVYSRQQIIDEVWNGQSITERTVDSHIANLRKKIADSDLKIKTLNSLGYSITLNLI